jgi:hypothetical protein
MQTTVIIQTLFFLLAADLISFANWIDRRTRLAINTSGMV